VTILFDNSFVNLPKSFYMRQAPVPVAAPRLVKFNHGLAAEIGVSAADLPVEVLAGNALPKGAAPLAAAYAGHQFGGFVPQCSAQLVSGANVVGNWSKTYALI